MVGWLITNAVLCDAIFRWAAGCDAVDINASPVIIR
jgi:hypothetical protein